MLSRRQIQKFGALCDDDLAFLEAQADALHAMRRTHVSSDSASSRHLVPVPRSIEDMRGWMTHLDRLMANPQPAKADVRPVQRLRRVSARILFQWLIPVLMMCAPPCVG